MSELNTDDYRNAPSGVGPLAATWKDKPHRLVYDLCTEVERQVTLISAAPELHAAALDMALELTHINEWLARLADYADGQSKTLIRLQKEKPDFYCGQLAERHQHNLVGLQAATSRIKEVLAKAGQLS